MADINQTKTNQIKSNQIQNENKNSISECNDPIMMIMIIDRQRDLAAKKWAKNQQKKLHNDPYDDHFNGLEYNGQTFIFIFFFLKLKFLIFEWNGNKLACLLVGFYKMWTCKNL